MAEQYSWISANNEGYSAGKFSDVDGNIMPWSRSTVADGKWLNKEMILPFSGRDQYLLDSLNQTYDECSAFSGDLQYQITVIEARADVVDVVGSYEEFVNTYSAGYVPGIVSDKDVIKILNDETSGNSQTYYRWLSADDPATGTWVGVGSLEPCYHSVSFNNNILTVNNTNIERTYTLSSEKYIDFNSNDNHYTFGLNDDFISSASQCYTALTSHSASWDETSATLNSYSANWQATYSAVSSNSAIWNETAYVPLSALECKIGSDNNVSDIAFAQGQANTAESTVFAQGKENIAKHYSFAQGYKNEVNTSDDLLGASFAQGYANTADVMSFAQGRNNLVSDKSFAQGSANTASENGFARGLRNLADGGFANGADNTAMGTGALAIGANNYAGNYAQALGHGVRMLGSTESLHRGGMAIGTFNKTSANLAFVIGNGLDDSRRSDLYWIDYNGNVFTSGNISAKNFYINGNPIDSIVSARFSAYNGDTKIAELPISAFKLQANTAKYISATSAANTMIFNVSDALINSASSGYQAKQWINTNGDGIIGSAKSGAAASAWITGNSGNYIPWTAVNGAVGHDNQLPSSPGDTPWMYFGDANTGGTWNSYAFGTKNFAGSNSLAAGNSNYATNQSLALGTFCRAEDDSIAVGTNNTAKYHSQAFGHGTHIEGHNLGSTTPYYLGGLAIGNYNKTTADVTFVIGNGHDGNDRSDLFFITTAGLVSAITVDTPKLSAENVTVYYTSIGNKKASVTIDGIQGFNQYIHEGGSTSDLWTSASLRQNNLTLAYHETNINPGTEIVKIDQSKVQYSSSNLTAPITASWPDILNGSLNAGNYVSAGNNQKLTIMSAENLTLANMQPGVIYLV